MSDKSAIEWTEATWNPIGGCTKVSPGCQHCYAMRLAPRIPSYIGLTINTNHGPQWTGALTFFERQLFKPLSWRKPKRVFVNSMSDLFHENVPDEWIDRVFAVMALSPQHTYQVLTKRATRMRDYIDPNGGYPRSAYVSDEIRAITKDVERGLAFWPLPNVWLGVSVENQTWADKRIPALLATPAAVRFLSCEPLLGAIDLGLRNWAHLRERRDDCRLDWVIAGGESGPGARPMHPDWVRGLRDDCVAAAVPFFFKQWGEWLPIDPYDLDEPFCAVCGCTENRACDGGCSWVDSGADYDLCSACVGKPIPDERPIAFDRVGKKKAGRLLDGREWNEYPAVTVG